MLSPGFPYFLGPPSTRVSLTSVATKAWSPGDAGLYEGHVYCPLQGCIRDKITKHPIPLFGDAKPTLN